MQHTTMLAVGAFGAHGILIEEIRSVFERNSAAN